jgi:hypothetical protein
MPTAGVEAIEQTGKANERKSLRGIGARIGRTEYWLVGKMHRNGRETARILAYPVYDN